MKLIFSFMLVGGCIFLTDTSLIAQKNIYLISGNLAFLSNETNIKIIYNYDNIQVGKLTEREYIHDRMVKLNSKGQNEGDIWFKNWINDRLLEYQPKFDDLLNKRLKKAKISISESNKDAKVSLIVKTTFIEPGFFAYKVSRPSVVEMEFIFFETNNPDAILAKLNGERFYGKGMDASIRITRSYGKAGKKLGKYFIKHLN